MGKVSRTGEGAFALSESLPAMVGPSAFNVWLSVGGGDVRMMIAVSLRWAKISSMMIKDTEIVNSVIMTVVARSNSKVIGAVILNVAGIKKTITLFAQCIPVEASMPPVLSVM